MFRVFLCRYRCACYSSIYGLNLTATNTNKGDANIGAGCALYLSDFTSWQSQTLAEVKKGKVDVLFIDALLWDKARPSHQSVLDALDVIREIKPRRAFLVGMGCALDHFHTNARIKSEFDDLPCPVELGVSISSDRRSNLPFPNSCAPALIVRWYDNRRSFLLALYLLG